MIGDPEARAVKQAINCGAVTHGIHVERFENAVAATANANHGVAVSSGTAALHLALLSANVEPGDYVVVPGFTFVAVANAVMYCGAIPNFIDCDKVGGISPSRLNDWLSNHDVKAVIAVHNFGHLSDIDYIKKICDRHGVTLIEDAAQALGPLKKITGHAAIVSFNGNKVITTGGGGMVLTDDEITASRIRSLATVSKIEVPNAFWHGEVGFNYRMPNMNAALGLAQMDRLQDILDRKAKLHAAYVKSFEETEGATVLNTIRPTNYWLNTITIKDESIRKDVVILLNSIGLESRLSWTPLNLLPMYQSNPRDDLSVTMKLANQIINIPSGPGIKCS